MMDVVSTFVGVSIPHGKLQECIQSLEEALRFLKDTPYHSILGRNFLHHVDNAADFIVSFYRVSRGKGPVGAMYFEMNGYDINPDRWYFNGFGYKKGGKLWDLTWSTEWLNPWDYDTDDFTLTGMDAVQDAFNQALYCEHQQALGIQIAGEIAECLVLARFDELMHEAHRRAKEACPDLSGVPVLSTAHEWSVLFPTQ